MAVLAMSSYSTHAMFSKNKFDQDKVFNRMFDTGAGTTREHKGIRHSPATTQAITDHCKINSKEDTILWFLRKMLSGKDIYFRNNNNTAYFINSLSPNNDNKYLFNHILTLINDINLNHIIILHDLDDGLNSSQTSDKFKKYCIDTYIPRFANFMFVKSLDAIESHCPKLVEIIRKSVHEESNNKIKNTNSDILTSLKKNISTMKKGCYNNQTSDIVSELKKLKSLLKNPENEYIDNKIYDEVDLLSNKIKNFNKISISINTLFSQFEIDGEIKTDLDAIKNFEANPNLKKPEESKKDQTNATLHVANIKEASYCDVKNLLEDSTARKNSNRIDVNKLLFDTIEKFKAKRNLKKPEESKKDSSYVELQAGNRKLLDTLKNLEAYREVILDARKNLQAEREVIDPLYVELQAGHRKILDVLKKLEAHREVLKNFEANPKEPEESKKDQTNATLHVANGKEASYCDVKNPLEASTAKKKILTIVDFEALD